MITRIDCAIAGSLALLALIVASGAGAQGSARVSANGYPAKPVRVIVPLAPGGGSDIVARIVAAELLNHWGQSVVVDNRPGAGSTVGTAIAAKAPADGYTLLVSSSSIAISPALYQNLDFDIRRDFSGVTLIASQPSILAVHASVPASTVKELVALAKAQPGKLTYASAGSGSATHLGAELFKYSTWYAMLAPAGTPKTIVNRIHADLAALIRTSQTRDRFVSLGMEAYGTTAAEMDAYLDSEIAKWSKVIRAAGVRGE